MIVDKLTAHFHSTPASHKLGVLFVVDSVTRQWIERAKHDSQSLTDRSPPDDSYVAGVNRMSAKVISLVKEMVTKGPADQKVCLAVVIL